MITRCGQLFRAGFAFLAVAAFWTYASTPALAQASVPGKDELQINDQPGYQPTPEDEELADVYQRQEVFFRTNEAPGTVVIHTDERYLYVVQGSNRALRYAIRVGREGFQWSGLVKISRKQEWPDWRPRPLSWPDGLSHPWHQSAADDRPCGFVGLFRTHQ